MQPPIASEIIALGFQPAEIKQIVAANIQALHADTHQLVERTIFTPNNSCFSLTTLPLPGDVLSFITIIKTVQKQRPQAATPEPQPFGARTQQALDLVLRGYSNKLIAREMAVSENTVKDHIKRIYRHFDVANRTELAWRLRRNQGH